MSKRIICLILLCSILLLIACSQQQSDASVEEPEFTKSQTSHFVYRDDFYYIKNGIIFTCPLEDLRDIDTASKCLCFDPLCEHRDSRCRAFTGSGGVNLCIRSVGGAAVLFTKYKKLMEEPFTYEIAQFDIRNSEKKILVEGIANPIEHFIVTDDGIVFEENLGDRVSLRAYSFADKQCFKQVNEDSKFYRLIGYSDHHIIYSDDECNVYSNTCQFDQEQKLLTGVLPYGYDVYDGDLYFPSSLSSKEVNGMSYNSANIYKTPLNSPSSKLYDIIAFNVCCYGKVSSYIFGGSLYYLPCEPSYVGEAKRSYDGMSEMTFTIINEHNGILWEVNTSTLSEELVVKDLGYNILDLIYASNEYVIFYSNGSGYRTDVEYDQFTAVFVYERGSGEMYRILYYGIDSETT